MGRSPGTPPSDPAVVERPSSIDALRALRASLVAELLASPRELSSSEKAWWTEVRLWCDSHESSLAGTDTADRLTALEQRLAEQDRARDVAADVIPPHVKDYWERS